MTEAKLKQLLTFLRTLRSSQGAGEAARHEQRMETQQRVLQACLLLDTRAGPPVQMAAATRMLEAVEVSCLSHAQKMEVVERIQEKASATMLADEGQEEANLHGNKKLQKVTFLYDYFTQAEWGDLVSQKQSSSSSKQKLIARRLARLGILYPNEDVFKLTTCSHAATGKPPGIPETSLQVTWHHACYSARHKDRGREACGFRGRSAAKGIPESGPAVPCPLDVPQLTLAAQLPAR